MLQIEKETLLGGLCMVLGIVGFIIFLALIASALIKEDEKTKVINNQKYTSRYWILVDEDTKCEYIKVDSAIIQRFDENGKQICNQQGTE